jgi:hypothetical protein
VAAAATALAPAATDVVEAGLLVHRGTSLARGAAIPANTPLRATEPARLRLASLRVVVAASAEIRWLPAERTVVLERGTLEVETTGTEHARVVTERFAVELDAAALTIDPATVRVHRGAARVVDRSHKRVTQLAAGDTWRVAESAVHAPQRTEPPTHAAAASAADLLAQARAQLAARDYAAAERTATGVLAITAWRHEESEARVLLADVAQASGALELAATRYLAVATSFADLPAAESALYAAARVELRRARKAPARALLERYLALYPAGRYTDDARRELASLP